MTSDKRSAENQVYRDPSRTVLRSQERILEMISAGSPLSEALTDLIRLVEQTSDGALGSVLLTNPGGRTFRLAAAPSLPAGYNSLFQGLAIAEGMGSCGTAMHRGEMVIVTDIETDPLWANYRELALRYDLRACWSVPIKSGDKVVGSFAMYYREPRAPDAWALRLIDAAGRVAAAAIEQDGIVHSALSLKRPQREPSPKRTILVVDDEVQFLELIETFLAARGYEVIVSSSALRALELFRSRSKTIDFVLTDVRMPEMNGPELTATMMELNAGLKFLFMSGDTGGLVAESSASLIQKPFELTELDRRIRKLLK